jgi:hypothetical protein
MAWQVEVSDEFAGWYADLNDDEKESVNFSVDLVEQVGPALGRPHVDTVKGSAHKNMKELRVQHEGHPYRILFAFDPLRNAYLILGGDKTGDPRWYEVHVPKADKVYSRYLKELEG